MAGSPGSGSLTPQRRTESVSELPENLSAFILEQSSASLSHPPVWDAISFAPAAATPTSASEIHQQAAALLSPYAPGAFEQSGHAQASQNLSQIEIARVRAHADVPPAPPQSDIVVGLSKEQSSTSSGKSLNQIMAP
ncbi:hypothetical protein, partial [Brucella intermedia]|uniref:hypothetical protein n=1 Tax=Brucella intermedia TaxID=94625 RepID=UPI002362F3A1